MSSSSYSYSSSPARKRGDKSDYSDYSSSSESERGPRRGAAAAKRDGPRKAVLHVRNLTRNVNAEHLQEIFGNYGTVQNVELAVDHEVQLPKGYAYIEFADHDLAAAAVKHMDGGQIDSNVVSVGIVGAPAAPKAAAPPPPLALALAHAARSLAATEARPVAAAPRLSAEVAPPRQGSGRPPVL